MKKNVNFKVKRKYEITGGDKVFIYEYKYDDHGNIIYEVNFGGNGYHWEYKYDDKGNKIYRKDSYGRERFYEYDDHNNKIYMKDSDGIEYVYQYDDYGNETYMKDYDGNEYYWEYKYDNKGNKIYMKDCDGKDWFYKYDDHNNMIYEKYPNGEEYYHEYKYDDKGNKIYEKCNEYEYMFEYEYNDNGIQKTHAGLTSDDWICLINDLSRLSLFGQDTFCKNDWNNLCNISNTILHFAARSVFDDMEMSHILAAEESGFWVSVNELKESHYELLITLESISDAFNIILQTLEN